MAGLNLSCKSQMLDTISRAIGDSVGDDIQQGGVCYPTVSQGRTRMQLRSPIRSCVIVNEKDLRPVEICELQVESGTRTDRERSMVFVPTPPTIDNAIIR
jgi:hypothetical protein